MNLEDYDRLTTKEKVNYFKSLPDSVCQCGRLGSGIGTYDSIRPSSKIFKVDDKSYRRGNPVYKAWRAMISRCNDLTLHKRQPSYKGTTVCVEWLTFSNFYSWWEENYVEGWELDKDILSDNKTYSPENCIYIPSWLNTFTIANGVNRGKYLIGAYWNKKECKFMSRCKDGKGKQIYLGCFDSDLEAHLAWREYKLNLAFQYKPEMDEIDLRIYPRVVEIINNLR